jgi:hypothetical protein
MARLNTNAELWSHLSNFYVLWDSTSGVSTTVDSTGVDIAATASTMPTSASATGLSTGVSYIRVGARGGAIWALVDAGTTGAGGTGTITARSQWAEAITDNEPVVEQVKTDLGDISDAGISLDVTSDMTTINVATQRHAYAHHVAHTDYACTVQLENLSIENLLVSMGMNDSNLHGAGTTADPNVADWLSANIDTINPLAFLAEGTRKDGTNMSVEFWDCDFDPAKTIAIARGQDAPVEFTFFARVIRWKHPV